MFEPLNLPVFSINWGRTSDGKPTIFDSIRGKHVAATPEEWVRQHFVNYLVNHLYFPKSFIANEIGLKLNGTDRRCDTIIYSRDLRPVCIIEYKRPSIDITGNVFNQIARYNSVLGAPFLIVSNGLKHFCCRYSGEGYTFLHAIPSYDEMLMGL